MSEPAFVRRASYGPSSPAVGARGARTRKRIQEAALELFARGGVNATAIDDIASAAGVSRATLYQYFANKEQIFLELVEESGAALSRVVRRLGPLGPDSVGFETLHWWLGEWGWVYERYATVFIQWASVDSPNAPLRPMIATWLENYADRLAARFTEAGVEELGVEDAAMALWSIVERFNYYRRTGALRIDDDAATDYLAVVAQLVLFPATPASALPSLDSTAAPNARPRSAAHPTLEELPTRGRFADVSDQAYGTVRQLLDAGGHLFATRGFHLVTVDQIVAAAGLARGTFYKYFEDRLDLLVTLSDECATDLDAIGVRLAMLPTGDARALRTWVRDFVELHRMHAGTYRVWMEGVPNDARLAASGRRAVDGALRSISGLLSRVDRQYAFDLVTASIMMLGLLERFPDQAVGTSFEQSPEQLVETLARVIERGFLNGSS